MEICFRMNVDYCKEIFLREGRRIDEDHVIEVDAATLTPISRQRLMEYYPGVYSQDKFKKIVLTDVNEQGNFTSFSQWMGGIYWRCSNHLLIHNVDMLIEAWYTDVKAHAEENKATWELKVKEYECRMARESRERDEQRRQHLQRIEDNKLKNRIWRAIKRIFVWNSPQKGEA